MTFSINELELFPFPISSIIRLYEAELNPRIKSDHLFQFFEALTEFISIILLSSLNQDKDFLFREFKPIKNVKTGWFKQPSIGDWNLINRTITKSLRRLREDKIKFKKCVKIFGNPSEDFIDNLTDKNIYNILDEVRNDRNNWKGHGGFLGPKKIQELLNKHNTFLESLKPYLISIFSSFELVHAQEIKYQKGIFNQKIRRIKGSSPPFKKEFINVSEPMEYEGLYLQHEGSDEPLKLIPFIKLLRGPKTNKEAFYFYNRVNQNQIRYISYHNEDDSESFIDLDTEIENIFSIFQDNNKFEKEKSPLDYKKFGEKYWEIFNELIVKFKKEKPGSTYRSSTVDSWLGLPIGTTGFHLVWSFIGKEPIKELEIGIHFENDISILNHTIFDFLFNLEDEFSKIFDDKVNFQKEWINNGEWSKIYILKEIETLNKFMRDQKLRDWAFDNMVKFYDLYMKYQKEIKAKVYQIRSSIKKI